MKNFIIWVVASIGAVLGISHPAVTSTTTTSLPIQQVVETSQVSNQQTSSSSGTSNNTTVQNRIVDTNGGASVQQSGQVMFTQSSGLYSFSYPSNWKSLPANVFSAIVSTQSPLGVILEKISAGGKENNLFSIEIIPDQTAASNFEEAGHMNGSSDFTKQNITLDGLPGYRMEYQDDILGQEVDKVRYVVPLTYSGTSAVLFITINAWDSTWVSVAEPVAKTVKVDQTKLPAVAQQIKPY